jgi:hypothetical protein
MLERSCSPNPWRDVEAVGGKQKIYLVELDIIITILNDEHSYSIVS